MKALSVKQPWAELIASGRKTIETRAWRTKHRGPLLICASKTRHEAAFRWFDSWMSSVDLTVPFPLGVAVAVVDLVDCRLMTEEDCIPAMYELVKYAWVLENVRRIEPFLVKGQLGVFEVDYEESTIDYGIMSKEEREFVNGEREDMSGYDMDVIKNRMRMRADGIAEEAEVPDEAESHGERYQ